MALEKLFFSYYPFFVGPTPQMTNHNSFCTPVQLHWSGRKKSILGCGCSMFASCFFKRKHFARFTMNTHQSSLPVIPKHWNFRLLTRLHTMQLPSMYSFNSEIFQVIHPFRCRDTKRTNKPEERFSAKCRSNHPTDFWACSERRYEVICLSHFYTTNSTRN